jgi:hypothetical protein
LKALYFSGRSMVMVATPPATAYNT